jgi:hypothetical protein
MNEVITPGLSNTQANKAAAQALKNGATKISLRRQPDGSWTLIATS